MGNPTWGDGKRVGSEKCDDENTANSDGCSGQRRFCYSIWKNIQYSKFKCAILIKNVPNLNSYIKTLSVRICKGARTTHIMKISILKCRFE